jgi:hypothetical protein
LAATAPQCADTVPQTRRRKQPATPADNQSTTNSFEVELDVGSILGAITERMFEHTSHRVFDYYADLISSTYDKELQLDYICNLFEIAIQTMTLTKDAKKRDALFSALETLNKSVFGMMDVPMAKKIRLSVAIRHLQKL